MPLTYRIDHERRIVIALGYGKFTIADILGYQHDVWSHSDVAGYDELVDMTHVGEIVAPSTEHIQDLATLAAGMDVAHASSRFAIVAPTDLTYGLGRMFQAYRESNLRSTKDVGVFRSLDEALLFLELDGEPPTFPVPAA